MLESCRYHIRKRRFSVKRGISRLDERSKYLLLGDDCGVKFNSNKGFEILNIGINYAAPLQKSGDDYLRALHTVNPLYIGFEKLFFHFFFCSFFPKLCSFSEFIITPIELSDIVVAQIDGCKTPAAATGMLIAL